MNKIGYSCLCFQDSLYAIIKAPKDIFFLNRILVFFKFLWLQPGSYLAKKDKRSAESRLAKMDIK